jgi:hypothetical protein
METATTLNTENQDSCCDKFCKVQKYTNHAILHVVSVMSNPLMYDRRVELFNDFVSKMKNQPMVNLITVELQNGNRPFVTKSTIQLRTNSTLWFKENLINIAVHHLPNDWEYMAWIDSDLEFQNANWVQDTIEQLQLFNVVQMFTHAIDLGPKKETLQVHTGFMYQYVNHEQWKESHYGSFFHPGYAWAIKRKSYDDIGGLLDFAILGSADHHMALAFIGLIHKSLNSKLHPNYKLMAEVFQNRCEKYIKRNVSFVPGTILHHYHGDKVDRKYQDRWMILISNAFDPIVDIKKDSSNLWVLENDKIKLRDDIIDYFKQRNEDRKIMNTPYKYTKKGWS